MKKRDKILNFILKPPLWLCIVIWTLGAVSMGGSITLYFVGLGMRYWAWIVHISALVFLLLTVYAILTLIGVPERAKSSPKVKTFFQSYNVRGYVYAIGAIVFNACYIVFGILIANLEQSPWLGVLVGYHVFLLLPRLEVFLTAKIGRAGRNERNTVRAYANCGLMITLLAVAVIPVVRMTANDQNSYNYFVSSIVYVIAIAAYSFTKLGIALYNMRKVRKQDDLALIAVKNVSFADALISIFALQALMLKELNTGFTAQARILNLTIGPIIALMIFALGLHMLVSGHKRLKAMERSTETPESVEDSTAEDNKNTQNVDESEDGDK